MSTITAGVQLCLFEFAVASRPAYWERLRDTREKLRHVRASKAFNTNRAYRHGWSIFERWCQDAGMIALPASSDTIEHFLVWCLYERPRRYRMASVKVFLNAIVERHAEQSLPSPLSDEIRLLVRNMRRDLRERKRGKDRIAPEQLRRVMRVLAKSDSVLDVRDRAMILLQFAAGWRGSEVISLDRADARFTAQGVVLTLGASKNDQTGSEGRVVGIGYGEREITCPVRALRSWLEVRGKWDGPLFSRIRISWGNQLWVSQERLRKCQAINARFREALERAGIDSKSYGSHSLRSGMVTAAIENGASETAIMLRTGHHRVETMRRYVRSARVFGANPLKGIL